ncbi:MAG: transglycosylase family protein [Thermoleophilia bacterium]|nr:transglycosylase family protein [Thermoleophilia bacterium]
MTETDKITGRAIAGALLGLIVVAIIAGNLLIERSTGAPADDQRSAKAESPGVQDRGAGERPGALEFRLRPLTVDPEGHLNRHRALIAETRARRLAEKKRQSARFSDLPGGVSLATLNAIAGCESGGDPRSVSSSGLYFGKYQFHTSTWAAVGGQGNPAEASEAEQDYRAALLYTRSGPGQWPVCGQ